MPENLLNTKQAAQYLGLENHNTLYVWQCNKRYKLPYIKIRSKVLYRKSDLDTFILKNLKNDGGSHE